MSGGWVAGTVRSRALAKRRLGRAGARALARSPSLEVATATLAKGPYGHDVRPGASLADAQHAVGDTVLWNVRVLAGWLPRDGVDALRALAGWFEVANIDELVRRLDTAGGGTGVATPEYPPHRLGALATSWPQVRDAVSLGDLRERLARSAWGDPGGDAPRQVQLGVRLAWAEEVAAVAEPARTWAAGGVALLLAREVVVARRALPDPLVPGAAGLVGPAAVAATDLGGLARELPRGSRWALDGVTGPADLWTAETRFWRRVEADAARLRHAPGFGLGPVIGAVVALAVDGWRVRAALTLAARHETSPEVLDAVV